MMDFVGPGIEGLLVVLLIAALLYGMRLEKKLKALRDTQAGFAEAVRMLDQAAARAETGLDTLRRTAEDAHDGLHGRIQKARELKAELEGLVARAERAAADLDRPMSRGAPLASLPARTSTPRLELGAPEPNARRVVFSAPADDETPLVLTDPIGPSPRAPQAKAPRPHIPPATSPSRRSAARGLDEDLFDNPSAGPAGARRIFGVRS
ncbi:MAG TPA: DUF6468 domain-containing protein [Caulobacteraceae bacterium]|jgi:hypothetical protein|nr:DUF6468 domain-containing protein [Caulobacteraceae bacterium]